MSTTTHATKFDSKRAPVPDRDCAITPPRTPTATGSAAHKVLAEIQSIYNGLVKLDSLAPGPSINDLLSRLVDLCVLPYSTDLSEEILRLCASTNLCERLRPICAEAEGELESHWAQRITALAKGTMRYPPHAHTHIPQPHIHNLASTLTERTQELKERKVKPASKHTTTTNPLHSFPYHQNYIDLSHLECASLEPFLASPPRNLAFIGSGPLPLTSLCVLDRYPTATIHNIDRDLPALQTSQQLCAQLGYSARSTFACADVSTDERSIPGIQGPQTTDWHAFDVVFLAALVGVESHEKIAILESLARKLRPGTLVVARSARGLRTVLYPVLKLGDELEKAGFEILVEVHPWNEVVNSVIVLRVK